MGHRENEPVAFDEATRLQRTASRQSNLTMNCQSLPDIANAIAQNNEEEDFTNRFGEISGLDHILSSSCEPSGMPDPMQSLPTDSTPVQQVPYDHWQFRHPVPLTGDSLDPLPAQPPPVQPVSYDHWPFTNAVPGTFIEAAS